MRPPPASGRRAALAVAVAAWWLLRGRAAGEYLRLREAADRVDVGSDGWCAAQFWLDTTARLSADLAGALGHLTAVREAADDGRRALALAREIDYPAGEALALEHLAINALYIDDLDSALQLARQ